MWRPAEPDPGATTARRIMPDAVLALSAAALGLVGWMPFGFEPSTRSRRLHRSGDVAVDPIGDRERPGPGDQIGHLVEHPGSTVFGEHRHVGHGRHPIDHRLTGRLHPGG